MCGVVGCFSKNNSELTNHHLSAVKESIQLLFNRGPDASDIYVSKDNKVILGHTRLAIIDPDQKSNQPFTRDNINYLSFNGEIYNFKEIASSYMASESFSTKSDTEVLYFTFVRNKELLREVEGMYAGSFYDGNSIHLFRDPLGIKPLYYFEDQDMLFFSSSLKVFKEISLFKNLNLCEMAKCSFIVNGHLDQGLTPYEEVSEVYPGSIISFTRGKRKSISYFSNSQNIFNSKEVSSECFSSIIDSTVKKHLISDVPIAIMFSAGLDSNLIAKSCSKEIDINAFTIGLESFKGTQQDEIPLARKVAQEENYGFNYEYISDKHLMDCFDKFLIDLDTLSVDGFNTWLASKFISNFGYKVALSGAGGDEIFRGYSNFRYLQIMSKVIELIPQFPRKIFSNCLPKGSLKLRKLYESINSNSLEELYFIKRSIFDLKGLSSFFDIETAAELYRELYEYKINNIHSAFKNRTDINISGLEFHFYCKNQLIKDADWASMAHSLELRVPFVDMTFFKKAIAFRNNLELDNKAKYYNLYEPLINKKLFEKTKTGFGLPILRIIGDTNDYEFNYKKYIELVYHAVTGHRIS